MKRLLLLCTLLLLSVSLLAQSYAVSRRGSLNIVKEIKPAILEIVPNSVEFIDKSGNYAIDALEYCVLKFKVHNSGLGEAYGCEVKISSQGSNKGLTYSNKSLSTIGVNETRTIEIPISSSMETVDGHVTFKFYVDEPKGFGTDPQELMVATRAFEAPYLQVVDHTITGTESSTLEKKKPFDLQILLQNTKHGRAENVKVRISIPDNVYIVSGDETAELGTMEGSDTHSLVYTLIANNKYEGSSIPVTITIKEKYGKYAENKTLNLAFNRTFASTKIVVDEVKSDKKDIQIAALSSEVDRNIPQNARNNTNTFAFIIANENYQNTNFANVPYALNDGKVFRDYCAQTLGLPDHNIYFHTDVTYAGMLSLLTQLKTTALVNENSNIIFYYAGHGAPCEGEQEAYLIPVDAYQVKPQICLNLQNIFDEFKELENSRVTVFLDACFSGKNRDNTMLVSARGVAITPKKNSVGGNLVVFSAATGDETAWPYNDEGHGLFTYYLLKKLQETSGRVTYGDLHTYLYENVRRTSNNINHKLQTPTLNASATLNDEWKTWRLTK